MRLLVSALLFISTAAVAADITFSGDAQYRFRFEREALKTTVDSVRYDLTHRYSWSLKANVKAKENLEFGMKLSNPSGASTDPVVQNDSFPNAKNAAQIVLREFYFHWTINRVSLWGVRIPVPGTTVLELAAYESKKYVNAGTDPWLTLTDNALNGLCISVSALENDRINLRPALLTAVAFDTGTSIVKPAERRKLDQWKSMLSLPIGLLKDAITITPMGYLRTNIAQSSDGSKSNNSAAAGLDAKAVVNKAVTLTAGFAVGGYKNDAQSADTTIAQVQPSGALAKICAMVKPGFGTLNAGLTFGQWKDALSAPDRRNRLIFGSLKYGIPVKNLTIEPWLRGWYYFDNQTDVTKLKIRSELSLIGSF